MIPAAFRSRNSVHGSTRPLSVWFWCFAPLLVCLVYLGTTGFLPLVGRDEPRYVQIGREMLDSGDWITPRLGGFTWFEKPALLYWMVAASFGVFGESEWAARLGPALCGLGSAALVWWMLRPHDEKWARWSAFSLASSGGLLAFSHGATFDIALTFCVTLALAAWWRAQNESQPEITRKFLALFWVGVGLAFLAKGLVGFVLTLGTLAIYAAIRRERVRLDIGWGLPLALVVALTWYGPVTLTNGATFLDEFFVQHHFARFASDKFKHHQPPWFYLEILPLLALPWTPFLIVALAKLRPHLLREATPQARLRALALAWLVVAIGFFSLSGSKLPGYILPALPAAFLLAGEVLQGWTGAPKLARFAGFLGCATLFGVAILTTTGPGIARAERSSVRALFADARAKNRPDLRLAFYQTTARGAQFYAANRLLYGPDEEPLRLETTQQVQDLVRSDALLLLVKEKNLQKLQSPQLKLETLARSGDLALVLAERPRSEIPAKR